MNIKHINSHVSLDQKEGKTYANVLLSILTTDGRTKEIELEVSTPLEEWEKIDYQKAFASKYRNNKRHTNQEVDRHRVNFSDD